MPRKYLWPEFPPLMGISASTKYQDRRNKEFPVCYVVIRCRTSGKHLRTTKVKPIYKEFPINPDTYMSQMDEAVEWMRDHNNEVPDSFTPPTWEAVLTRMNIKQEKQVVTQYVFYDMRSL